MEISAFKITMPRLYQSFFVILTIIVIFLKFYIRLSMHVQVYTHRNVFYFNLNKEQLKGKNDDNRSKADKKKKKRRISGMNYLGSNTKSTC